MTYQLMRTLFAKHNGTFMTLTFRKKDGTLRTLNCQQDALRTNAKGADASPAAQQAVATRAANYPNLLNVWVVKRGFRTVNLDTLTRVAMRGSVYLFDKTQFMGFENGIRKFV